MNPCPNHPAGRTCFTCDPPAAAFTGWDVASLLLRWIVSIGVGLIAWICCMACPILLVIPVTLLLLYAVIKSAVVAACREVRR